MSTPVALVLAAGASHRFWPLHEKLLMPFGAMSLLERHLRTLKSLGYERCVVVAGPDNRERIEAITTSVALPHASVVVQPEPRGMADAVVSARDALTSDSSIFLSQSHDVVDPEIHAELLARWSSADASCSGLIAAVRTTEYFPGGYLTLDGGRITSVIEKPGAGNEPSDLVNLVAHVHRSSRALLDAIEVETSAPGGDDVYERALSRLMTSGDYRAVEYEGRWQALKFPWNVLDVMDMLLDRWTRGLESPGEDYEARDDGVFVGRDVRIFPGAYVVGPALIGHGVVIGHNALVRGSIIGQNSVVGFGSEVARSYLAEGVELHHNYVGDSVFDEHCAMGYGACTANYRLDGRTVPMFGGSERIDTGRMKLGLILGAQARIGVNASTMPGVKIGAKAIVGPNLRVSRDVPEGERVMNEEKYGLL